MNYKNGAYVLVKEKEKIYTLLKGLRQNQPELYKYGYKLNPGDNIRFGRTHFTVREISHSSIPDTEMVVEVAKELEEEECRICASSESSPENPLISPCNCAGTIKFVHINCMKAWYESKTTCKQSNNTSRYTIYKLNCELCNTKLPLSFFYSGKKYDLVNIKRPESNAYIILESSFESKKRIYVVVIPKNTTVTIVS